MKIKEQIIYNVKNKTLLSNLFNFFLLLIGDIDINLFRKIRTYKTYKKLKKNYKKYLDKDMNIKLGKLKEFNKNEDIIWVFWYQGIENAPIIVKKCFDSLKRNFADKKVICLSKDNYMEYIKLPDYIISKFEENIISVTHFSDILRTALLVEYGGLWLDATVYCTGNKEMSFFKNYDLFLYRDGWFDNDTINIANWLIYAKENNFILNKVLTILLLYWKKENYTYDYFIYHMIFKLVTDQYRDEWEKTPYFNHINNHLLVNVLFKKFDQKEYNKICSITDFHKLTYKIDLQTDNPDSYYHKIIEK